MVSKRHWSKSLVAAVLGLSFAAVAQAPLDIRVALVIGNSAYPGNPLANPVNDARAMSETLGKLGFSVLELRDASKDEMVQAIAKVRAMLKGKQGVGMMYYAGHGLQVDWRNFMVPVSARLSQATDVPQQAVDIDSVVAAFRDAGNRMNILVLDACRDNPFGGTTSAKGLAPMDAPPGTLLAYATAPGNVAEDGDEKTGNGLYTQYLLQELMRPVAKIEDVFKRVRLNVRRQSQGRQIPWESTSLEEDFYFNDGTRLVGNVSDLERRAAQAREQEAALQKQIANAKERERQIEAELASERARMLEAQRTREAEAKRLAQEQAQALARQQAEALRQEQERVALAAKALAEERWREQQLAKAKAEQEELLRVQEAQARRVAQEQAAERARQDEELRRLEASRAEAQAKLLEAARKAEDARLREQEAARAKAEQEARARLALEQAQAQARAAALQLEQERAQALQREREQQLAREQEQERVRLAEAQKLQDIAAARISEAQARELEEKRNAALQVERDRMAAAAAALAQSQREQEARRLAIEEARRLAQARPAKDKRSEEERQERTFAEAKELWDKVRLSKVADDFYAFLDKFPSAGELAELAQSRLDQLAAPRVRPSAGKGLSAELMYAGPKYRLGDEFVFRTTDLLGGDDATTRRWRVTKVSEEGIEINGGGQVFTELGSAIQTGKASFDPPYGGQPAELQVGKKWSSRTRLEFLEGEGMSGRKGGRGRRGPTNSDESADIKASSKIVGVETITVPAGVFQTYVIETLEFRSDNRTSTIKKWVDPRYGFPIRQETTTRSSQSSHAKKMERTELVQLRAYRS